MEVLQAAGQAVVRLIRMVYNLLWGDIVQIPLPGGSSLGLSLLVIILIPAGIYFTIRTRFLPFRLFPETGVLDVGDRTAWLVHRVCRGNARTAL